MSVTNSHPIPFTDSHSNFRYRDHFGILRNSEGGIILEPYPTKTTNELAREFFNSSRGEIASDGPPSGFSFTQSPNPGSSSSQAPSSFSSSAASGIFALFFAGRVLKVHCQNNKRLNAEHGLNPRSLGWFEKIGLRGVKVIEVTINGHPCTVACLPRCGGSSLQIIGGHPDLIGKRVDGLTGRNWVGDGIAQLNDAKKDSAMNQTTQKTFLTVPSSDAIQGDLPVDNDASHGNLPASFILANSKEFPVQKFENNPDPISSNSKPPLEEIPYLVSPDTTFTQQSKILQAIYDEYVRIRSAPIATAVQKESARIDRFIALDEFLSETRLLRAIVGPNKYFFDACQQILKNTEARHLANRKLIEEGKWSQQLARDCQQKADASAAGGDSSKQAEYEIQAAGHQKAGVNQCQYGLKGAIWCGVQAGVTKEFMYQCSALPNTMRLYGTLSGVDAAFKLVEKEGGFRNAFSAIAANKEGCLQEAATAIAVDTAAGTLVHMGTSIIHAGVTSGLAEYSKELADKVPGVGVCVQTVQVGYTLYAAETYTEGLSSAFFKACDSGVEVAAGTAATGILGVIYPPAAPLGPAVGKAAWKTTKIVYGWLPSRSAVWGYFSPATVS